MKKYALLASAASLFAATSAIAADLPARKVAPVAPIVPAFTWTGFYAGVNAGVNWSSRNVNTSLYDAAIVDPFPAAILSAASPVPYGNSRTGFIGGIQLGYNYQINQFVIGAEADFMGAALSKSSTALREFTAFNSTLDTTTTTKIEQNWLGTVRARAGFAADRFMIYATGGLAYGNVKSRTNLTLNDPTAVDSGDPSLVGYVANWAGSKTETKAGYVVGAGVEYALTNNWIIRGEYLYYNLGTASNNALGTTETNGAVSGGPVVGNNVTTLGARTRTTIDGNIVRAALSYKF